MSGNQSIYPTPIRIKEWLLRPGFLAGCFELPAVAAPPFFHPPAFSMAGWKGATSWGWLFGLT